MDRDPQDKHAATAGSPRLRLPLLLSLLTVAVLLLAALIVAGYPYPWTGFGASINTSDTAAPYKTLWDWLELLTSPPPWLSVATC